MARESGRRHYKGLMGKVVAWLAVTMSVYHVLYISGVLAYLNIYIMPEQHLAAHLGFVMALVFLLVPATKGARRDRLPWYDIILLIGGVTWNLYMVINIHTVLLHSHTGYLSPLEQVLTLVMIGVVIEAARRQVGPVLPSIAVFFLIYTLFSNYFPGVLHAAPHSLSRVARHAGGIATGLYGPVLTVSATIIVMFIMFGEFLNASGAGRWFIGLAQGFLGRYRGGPAKVGVVASSLFGTISGSSVANAATVGVMTIPMMTKVGYRPQFAGAVEAAASNGGQLMPPIMGAAAFIMADFLGISYGKLALAAMIPAIIYYAALFVSVDLEAAKNSLAGLPRDQIPSIRKTFLGGWHYTVPLAILIVLLLVLLYSPERSALYGMVGLVLVSLFRKEGRVGFRTILTALRDAATGMVMIGTVCALAGIIISCLSLSGLGMRLALVLIQLSGGSTLLLLLLAAVVIFMLGMGVTTTPNYILIAILIAPALISIGIAPIAAHLFIFYYAMASLITPPVCPTTYVTASIAKSDPWRTGWDAVRIGIATFVVPLVFVYSPALLLIGSPSQIALTSITALLGTCALAAGFVGYILRPLNWTQRAAVLIAGVLLILPLWQTTPVGLAILILVILWQVLQARVVKRRREIEQAGMKS